MKIRILGKRMRFVLGTVMPHNEVIILARSQQSNLNKADLQPVYDMTARC
jgi:hypothetical protein